MEKHTGSIKTVYFVIAALVGSSIALQSTPAVSRVEVEYKGSSQTSVVCPAKGVPQVDLYNEQLVPTGKKANAFSPVQVFQGWGTNEKVAKIRGAEIKFFRVQVPGFPGDQFVRELEITTTAACQQRRGEAAPETESKPSDSKSPVSDSNESTSPESKSNDSKSTNSKAKEKTQPSAKNEKPSDSSDVKPSNVPVSEAEDEEGNHEETDDEPVVEINLEAIIAKPPRVDITKGLKSSKCCLFPLVAKPTSYLSGKGRFGAGRRGGRTHAGADLYGKHGQAVRSIYPGVIIRSPYYFKGKTFAVDVLHSGGFVVRYGEIMTSGNLKVRKTVITGEKIGQIKKLPCCSPMLHFELYTGARQGKLSQPRANKYHRRGDLVDPTPYLNKWSVK